MEGIIKNRTLHLSEKYDSDVRFSLTNIYQSGKFSDGVIICQNGKRVFHRFVLAQCSRFWNFILSEHNVVGSLDEEVVVLIPDASVEDVEQELEKVYGLNKTAINDKLWASKKSLFTSPNEIRAKEIENYALKKDEIQMLGEESSNLCLPQLKISCIAESLSSFSCDFCDKTFWTEGGMKSHKESHKYEIVPFCEQCKRAFENLEEFKLHSRSHDIYCRICYQVFSRKPQLNAHAKLFHGSRDDEAEAGVADFCLGFEARHKLRRRKLREHSSKAFICEFCSQNFKSKQLLTIHTVRKHSKVTMACKECGKSCSNKYALARHLKDAHSDKRHICEHCGSGFKRKDRLTIHVRRHTGDKPFRCSECSYCTIDSSGLIHHKKKKHPNVS